jgi:hypothetical protein
VGGTGIALPVTTVTAPGAAPVEQAGMASAIHNASRQLGQTFGVALRVASCDRFNAAWRVARHAVRMDTFRLSPDSVRRLLPSAANLDDDRDDAERLAERVREVEPRVGDDDSRTDGAA